MYSTHNERKSVVGESFIKTLKTKIYKYMVLISKNVHIDKLDSRVNKYKNTCHNSIKIKHVGVKGNTYIELGKENNDKNPKFKIGDYVRISKYKNTFAKGCAPDWSEEVFIIKKVKILFHGHMLLIILMVKKLLERFMKKNSKNQIKKNLK